MVGINHIYHKNFYFKTLKQTNLWASALAHAVHLVQGHVERQKVFQALLGDGGSSSGLYAS